MNEALSRLSKASLLGHTMTVNYAARTVSELKNTLRARGLKVSGKKSELIARIQKDVTGGLLLQPPKQDPAPEEEGKPKCFHSLNDEEIVRPGFWNESISEETVSNLQQACETIINHEAQLEFQLQAELLPYIFWPPQPGWCVAPLDTSISSANDLPKYGIDTSCTDKIWEHAVLGIFQPKRTHFQLFEHILIPVYHPWADDSLPEETITAETLLRETRYKSQPMWGLLHYQKGSHTAYMHVLTEWQEAVFNNKVHNRVWTKKLIQKLTGERGLDANLFYGNRARIKTKWLPNLTGPDWQRLGWSGRDMAEVSQQSFFYVLYVAMEIVLRGARDTEIPAFGASGAFQGLAQALLGISTALEHGEVGTSVRGGIEQSIREGASFEVLAHRAELEKALETVTTEFTAAVKAEAASGPEIKLEPNTIPMI